MWNLLHNADSITGGAVSVLAGAVLKLFNDSQRVFYRPVRFLPADIELARFLLHIQSDPSFFNSFCFMTDSLNPRQPKKSDPV